MSSLWLQKEAYIRHIDLGLVRMSFKVTQRILVVDPPAKEIEAVIAEEPLQPLRHLPDDLSRYTYILVLLLA